MADFNLTNIRALTKGINKLFTNFKKKPESKYLDIATKITTADHTIDYAWLGDLPATQSHQCTSGLLRVSLKPIKLRLNTFKPLRQK
ncbi:hypothetical protein CVPH_0187 [Abyssogena phaseoliformis symbiont OG214]|uniref:Mu-like prophage major head subunit gpT family protein n=1 Tax=Abyssogena phaseoliformis symbiont TaxID=596095 RepID=UPI001915BE40|nr:Mu-like prophage major head subunit gpT family protein [Abyssogena phaseoliformis symbiont]MBW5289457.1 hypothetical protein [Candidatus Ruthia sp. Apha_13_S6]BBB22354.1 hypothetical protein CVPH_0187 [Abyssogena phaseoliformis symbiont OG214]